MVIQLNRRVLQIGNSLGVTIPCEDIEAEGIDRGEIVEVIIRRRQPNETTATTPTTTAEKAMEYIGSAFDEDYRPLCPSDATEPRPTALLAMGLYNTPSWHRLYDAAKEELNQKVAD